MLQSRDPETTKMTTATGTSKGTSAPANDRRLEACATQILEAVSISEQHASRST